MCIYTLSRDLAQAILAQVYWLKSAQAWAQGPLTDDGTGATLFPRVLLHIALVSEHGDLARSHGLAVQSISMLQFLKLF